jgi:hypothetical protein
MEGMGPPSPRESVLRCGQHGLSVLFVFDRFMQNLCNCVFDGTFRMLFVCYLFVIYLLFDFLFF